ncbi:MAG: DUF4124 domain-containing protein [Woeseiaceae bacterium]|nr:DUF4124 domain-containing protein [Woeseiaceae bacterium]
MKKLLALLLVAGLSTTAAADVWMWVDAQGNTHFVDTNRPIYTWIDEFGKVHYADTPDHEGAVSVQLKWVSSGTLEEVMAKRNGTSGSGDKGYAHPGETAEERAEREAAEAYYCKRAKEIYESYVNAPDLYRTDENGERVYLTKAEAKATIAETKAKMEDLCR